MDRDVVRLLDADPDLGQLLVGCRASAAREELTARLIDLRTGPWDLGSVAGAAPDHLGLLLVHGLVVREVAVEDNVGAELIGQGDVVRPWHVADSAPLVGQAVRWTVLAPSRVALLDRRVGCHLARYPEVTAVLLDRISERAERLATAQAISQLNGVDRRLVAMLWHVASRFGRVTPDGVLVPLALSHRVLAELVGARRPTVSTTLADLDRRGEVIRRRDGTWLLRGEPVGVPDPEAARPVRQHLSHPVLAEAEPAWAGVG